MITEFKIFERQYTEDGEIKQSLSKKTVDYNKIYTYGGTIGKMIPIRDVGCIMQGYTIDGQEVAHLIKYGNWKWVKEATPEEIEQYEISKETSKYNL